MIELVRHIEILLLENDCVVVPDFGGFIAHDVPALWKNEEKLFLPPMRTIGFNPQLKMNDGILVQSYMEAYNTDFSDATKILQQEVDKLIEMLHKEGKVDLVNIGELSLSIHGTYIFSSYDDKIVSPSFYGLDSFDLKELSALKQLPKEVIQPVVTVAKKTYDIRINRTLVRHAVAVIAALLLFFHMSAPIENTYVETENYAQILPADLFGKIEQYSLLATSIHLSQEETQPEQVIADQVVVPVAVRDIEIPQNEEEQEAPMSQQAAAKPLMLHHIIIASLASENDAHAMVADLKQKGCTNASVLVGEGRIRVSIGAYSNKEEADRQLVEVRKNNAYKNAWLLVSR